MYCPSCRDEFRSGFVRCESCGVDLVHDLPQASQEAEAPVAAPVVVTEYCGYVELAEARLARDRLRQQQIASEIVIREAPGGGFDRPIREEYWLRVDGAKLREAHDLLGGSDGFGEEYATDTQADDDSFTCSECGGTVAATASACPGCGARFDES